MLNNGDRIRDFKVINKIGEGGMGAVYLAEDEMLHKKIAIKVLSPHLISDQQFVERFKNEAKVQASLNHPNIVTLYSLFQENSSYYMVMEYVNGKTIKEILKEKGAFSEYQAKKYFLQILDAISFAHSMGIIHRDLKPSNILIDVNDNVKIMDFGIAKVLGDRNLTKTGTKLGTIFYMSPEQILADKSIDQRSDIYSLGMVFYEMLTGAVPFNSDTDSDYIIMQQIVQGKGIDENELKGKVSDVMIKVLLKMTSKDRINRFATCYQIAEALKLNKATELEIQPPKQNKDNFQPIEIVDNNKHTMEEFEKNVFPKANFGKRIAAFFIDVIILTCIIVISGLIMQGSEALGSLLFLIGVLILGFIRDGINKGKGIGKGMVGLRIINLNEQKVISISKAFARRFIDMIIYFIPFIIFIDIYMCNTKRGRRIIDRILDLQVVNESDIIVDEGTGEVRLSEIGIEKNKMQQFK